MDNDDVVMTIESRLKLMTQKMSQLVNSWNEQTRGLHLDSDGQLRGSYTVNHKKNVTFFDYKSHLHLSNLQCCHFDIVILRVAITSNVQNVRLEL